MLVGFVEGLGAAKTYAQKHGYRIDANRELVGLAASNLGAGLASGMVVNGSLSKTAVNGGAGARSQVSGFVVAALTVVTLLFMTGLFEMLPDAALAAVVIAAVLLLLYRASRPHVALLGRAPNGSQQWADLERHPENQTVRGVAVVRIESGLSFANADYVSDRLREIADVEDVQAVVLDAVTIPVIDTTAAEMLRNLARELSSRRKTLFVVGDIGQVRDVIREAGTEAALANVYPTVDAAIGAAAVHDRPNDDDSRR